jgi:hypothetical protein
MKNIAKNTISYTGVVTISRYSNDKKIEIMKVHNQGRNPLFDFLADCLVGDYTKASISIPDKIMLLKASEDDTQLTASSGFIHVLTPPEKITREHESCARYSFLVTSDKIEKSFNRIGLYTKAATDDINELWNYAAYCNINEINNTGRSAAAALVIDWELIISNSTKEI